MPRNHDPLRDLHDAAYAASDAADLPQARNLGIAARKHADVASALAAWARARKGRVVEAIGSREHAPPAFDASHAWWRGSSDEAGG